MRPSSGSLTKREKMACTAPSLCETKDANDSDDSLHSHRTLSCLKRLGALRLSTFLQRHSGEASSGEDTNSMMTDEAGSSCDEKDSPYLDQDADDSCPFKLHGVTWRQTSSSDQFAQLCFVPRDTVILVRRAPPRRRGIKKVDQPAALPKQVRTCGHSAVRASMRRSRNGARQVGHPSS